MNIDDNASSGDSGASVGVGVGGGGGGGADDGDDGGGDVGGAAGGSDGTDGDGVHLSSLLLLLAVVASRSRNLSWNKYKLNNIL